MKFFFDNTTSPYHARAVAVLAEKNLKCQVRHLRDRFAQDTPDVEWLTTLGDEGDWIVVSGDERITKNHHEQAAWLNANLTAFFLAKGWQNLTFWVQAAKLIEKWPLIVEQAERVAPGAGFLVQPKSPKLQQIRLK